MPFSKQVEIDYTNHRGLRGWRLVLPSKVWFGASPHHEGWQWFLKAHDLDKGAERDFALCDIHEWRRNPA